MRGQKNKKEPIDSLLFYRCAGVFAQDPQPGELSRLERAVLEAVISHHLDGIPLYATLKQASLEIVRAFRSRRAASVKARKAKRRAGAK